MAANFVAASDQYLLRTGAPVTAPPFTMACWARPTFAGNGGGNQGAISIANGSTGFSQWTLGVDGTPEWWIRRDEATSNLDELDVATGIVANTWQFAVARIVSASNCWLHILNASGSISSGQTVLTRNPTGINNMVIGAPGDSTEIGNSSFDGPIAEAWIANIDIQPDGGTIDQTFMRYLAWNGPWSIPRIAASIVEYKPLLQNFVAGPENYAQSGFSVWTQTNGPLSIYPAPPLAPGYLRPTPVSIRRPVLWVGRTTAPPALGAAQQFVVT